MFEGVLARKISAMATDALPVFAARLPKGLQLLV